MFLWILGTFVLAKNALTFSCKIITLPRQAQEKDEGSFAEVTVFLKENKKSQLSYRSVDENSENAILNPF